MADVIVTFRIMPDNPEVDLNKLEENVKKELKDYGCKIAEINIQEVAFGLKSLNIIFSMDEAKGDTEPLEEKIRAIEGVNSTEVVNVTRSWA